MIILSLKIYLTKFSQVQVLRSYLRPNCLGASLGYYAGPIVYYSLILLIDWFSQHVNASRIILDLGVRELRTLYVHVYIFM